MIYEQHELNLHNMAKVFLKEGREEAPSRGHPWVFSGAIDRVEGTVTVTGGGVIDLFSHGGEFIGRGYHNPSSQIAVRLLTRQRVAIDEAFFRARIEQAISLRRSLLSSETTSCRLIHSEGDFLPGLIVDMYGSYLVLQVNTAGIEKFRGLIISILKDLFPPAMMYDRSDPATRAQEGLPDSTGPIGDGSVPDNVEIRENGIRFLVNIKGGQKTGFYFDQRENRTLIGRLSHGKRVLNCFAYTGAFSVYASHGGADGVTSVEASADALELCKKNLLLNDIPLETQRLVKGDVFDFLRDDQGEYDLIVLDPPAFAKRRGQVKGAIRGYKDINLYAMRRAKKMGMVLTCSCSQHIDTGLFQKILSYAATDSHRQVQILGQWGAPFDHPTALHHPEGAYLKAFLLRVVE